VYDADSAGSKATLRGVDLIIGGGLEVRVAALPEGEDPDSYVKRYGGEAFRKLLAASVSFLDFKAEAFRAQGLLENPEGKTRAVRSLVETIATMKDELKRNFYVKSIAEKYNIYESVLFRELERVLGQERSRQQFVSRKDSGTTPAASTAPSARPTTGQDIPAAERDLLKVMLEHGHTMAQFVFSHVGPELFTHPAARAVITLIESHGSNPWEVNALINEIDNPGLRRLVTDIVFTRYDISKGWAQIGSEPHEPTPEEVAEASIIVLQRREIDRKIAGLFQQLKSAGAGGEELAGLQQQILQLQRDRKELQSKKFVRS
jgi:DNA primase